MTLIRSELIGFGHYLPAKVLTNDDMAKMVETNDEWISTRTGIKSRHVAAENEFTSDISLIAARNALKSANISAEDLVSSEPNPAALPPIFLPPARDLFMP